MLRSTKTTHTKTTESTISGNRPSRIRPSFSKPPADHRLKSLQKLIQASRSNGRLNISNLELESIPDEVWGTNAAACQSTVLDVSFDRPLDQGSWWEVCELKRLVAADNHITAIDPRIADLGALVMLDLHNNQISSIPDVVGSLQALSILNLSFNCITCLPDSLFQLPLVELHVQGNALVQLSDAIGNLSRLSHLDLSDNKLSALPPSISKMTCLTKLNVSKNQLTSLESVDLSAIVQLTELNLSYNLLANLSAFSIDTISLPKLKILDVKHNRLSSLTVKLTCPELVDLCLSFNNLSSIAPGVFFDLIQLETLDLRDNALCVVPDDTLQLHRLKRLDLTNNNISRLQPELGLLHNLTMFLVYGNPIRGLPTLDSTVKLLEHLQKRIVIPASSHQIQPNANNAVVSRGIDQSDSLPPLHHLQQSSVAPSQQEYSSRVMNLSNQGLDVLGNDILSNFDFAPSTIDVSQNRLKNLPNHFNEYSNSVVTLIARQNLLTVFPNIPFGHLKILDLSRNKITQLSESLPLLPRLDELNLSFNQLVYLPSQLSFPNLTVLLVSNNRLEAIDPHMLIQCIPGIQILDVSNNSIQTIPPELALLPCIKSLQLSGNMFRVPRAAILQKGTEAICEYLKSRIPV
ncbi:hypothetical protein O5D80_007406 [Batrachochytrium dendrobatidis]|nr:hypothetical protein O5D80_007406 [Batrachochytrium dendrobatidis]